MSVVTLRIALIALAICIPRPADAQLVIKLKPATLNAFEDYSKRVEAVLAERWKGSKPFLQIDESADDLNQVMNGELLVRQLPAGRAVEVPEGLIHDWVGAVYFPHASMAEVLRLLQNFDAHKKIYPQIADSKTIRRSQNDITGYWRLQQKGLVPAAFNVEQEAHYQRLGPGKWAAQAYSRDIREINISLFGGGKEFPAGEGHGYLWRLYAYWTLRTNTGGVVGECRTLSLSRDIPEGLAWAVTPFIEKMPQESLLSTLRETRNALRKQGP